jgi:hypothetical protein
VKALDFEGTWLYTPYRTRFLNFAQRNGKRYVFTNHIYEPLKACWLIYVPPVLRIKSPYFSHTMYLYGPYDTAIKQGLIPYAALIDWCF